MIHLGDSRAVMATMEANSFDSIVTDPPYELGFMGKSWDASGVAFDPDTWRAALRVLKPGGHMLAFGATRKFHRLMVAIEDAGFELVDTCMWIHGQGFPKSVNVAKAIDKARVEDIEPTRVICRALRAELTAQNVHIGTLAVSFGVHPRMVDHWAARDTDSQPTLPTNGQWQLLLSILRQPSHLQALTPEVERLNARKGTKGAAWQEADVIGEHTKNLPGFTGERFEADDRLIRAPSAAAAQWAGWGTALKPAWEPIILARKPLRMTIAQCVQKHGTGAINIEASMVPTAAGDGRWPANVLHDGSDEVVAAFPQAPGQQAPITGAEPSDKTSGVFGAYFGRTPSDQRDGGGSAARFFYCAKASAEDRNHGLPPGTENMHPTVKPHALMRWCVRLVTPPGGRTLDLFCGSGSTIRAAVAEGFQPEGIDNDPESARIATLRAQGTQPGLAL